MAIGTGADAPLPLRTPGGSDRPDWPATEAAIRQLIVNYTHGTDAVGRSDMESAMAFYRQTFSDDAVIMVDGAESTRRVGPEAWAGFVEATFRGRDDIRTQHLVGSINLVPVDETTVEASSYMHAAHLRPNGDVLFVLLTYVDRCERRPEGWRIVNRVLYPMNSWMQKA